MEPQSRLQNGKGQTAVEFFFLIVFVLFLATVLLVVLGNQLEREQDIRDQIIMDRLSSAWQQELGLAASGPQSYERVFQFPVATVGHPIYTKFGKSDNNISDEISFRFRGEEYLYFLPTDVGYQELATDEHEVIPYRIRVIRECYDSKCQLWLSDESSEVKRPSRTDSYSQKEVYDLSSHGIKNVVDAYPYILTVNNSGSNDLLINNIEDSSRGFFNTSFSSEDIGDAVVKDDTAFISGRGPGSASTLFAYNTSNNFSIIHNVSLGSANSAGRLVFSPPFLYISSGSSPQIHSLLWNGTSFQEIDMISDSSETVKEYVGMEKIGGSVYSAYVRNLGFDVVIRRYNISNPFSIKEIDTASESAVSQKYMFSKANNVLYLENQGAGAKVFSAYNPDLSSNHTKPFPANVVTPHHSYSINNTNEVVIRPVHKGIIQEDPSTYQFFNTGDTGEKIGLFDTGLYGSTTNNKIYLYR